MATIQSTMTMADKMTPSFNAMIQVMERTLSTMRQLKAEVGGGIGEAGIPRAINNIGRMDGVVRATRRSVEGLTQASNNTGRGFNAASRNIQRMQGVVTATRRNIQQVNREVAATSRSTNKFSSIWNSIKAGVTRAQTSVSNFTSRLRESARSGQELNNSLGSINLSNLYYGVQILRSFAQAVGDIISKLDEMTLIIARLDNINDGLQSTAVLQDKIFDASNRARAGYQDMAQDVAKLNLLAKDQFKTNDEAIKFVETLYKIGTVSGTGSQEMAAAIYQLNQAMAAGKLQGDEFRSVMENLPMLADGIAKQTGKTKANLKEMSSDGVITADIIKNAVFNMTNDIEKDFEKMPKTFGQMWQLMENHAIRSTSIIQQKFSEFINSDKGQAMFDGIINSMESLAQVGLMVMDGLIAGVTFVSQHWNIIFPFLIGLLTVLGTKAIITGTQMFISFLAANTPLLILAGIIALIIIVLNNMGLSFAQIGYIVGEAFKFVIQILWVVLQIAGTVLGWLIEGLWALLPVIIAIGMAMLIYWVGTLLMKLAILPTLIAQVRALAIQWLLVNWPILLVALAILAVILVLGYLGVTTADVVGFIVGCWYGFIAVIQNIFIFLYNGFTDICTFIGNAFSNAGNLAAKAWYSTCEFFLDAIKTVAQALESLLNMIPFVEVKFTGGIDNLLAKVRSAKAEVQANIDGNWKENTNKLQYKDIGAEYKRGNAAGKNFMSNFSSSIKNLGNFTNKKPASLGAGSPALKIPEVPGMNNIAAKGKKGKKGNTGKKGDGKLKGGKLDKVGKIEDDVTITDEDIKMLKDIATTEFINSYTTLQPNMKVEFTGPIHQEADVNKIASAIETMTEEALAHILIK